MECIEEMHVYIRGKTMDFPLRKDDLPIIYLNCRGVKEKIMLDDHECCHPGYK
jgi:hypothetical protein